MSRPVRKIFGLTCACLSAGAVVLVLGGLAIGYLTVLETPEMPEQTAARTYLDIPFPQNEDMLDHMARYLESGKMPDAESLSAIEPAGGDPFEIP